MASPRSLHTKIAALLVVATVSIGVLVPQTDAFVSGGPGRSSKAPKPSRQEGKTQLEEVDSRPALEAADDPRSVCQPVRPRRGSRRRVLRAACSIRIAYVCVFA